MRRQAFDQLQPAVAVLGRTPGVPLAESEDAQALIKRLSAGG
jgi:hypothetical protein